MHPMPSIGRLSICQATYCRRRTLWPPSSVMDARWASSPEPLPIQAVGPGGQQFQILDLARLGLGSRTDTYPGESEVLDVAVRIENDVECYGWNNETYFSQPIGRNQNWRLDKGRYLVRVTVVSSGQKCVDVFRLINDVGRQDCRLEPATEEDKLRIKGRTSHGPAGQDAGEQAQARKARYGLQRPAGQKPTAVLSCL